MMKLLRLIGWFGVLVVCVSLFTFLVKTMKNPETFMDILLMAGTSIGCIVGASVGLFRLISSLEDMW